MIAEGLDPKAIGAASGEGAAPLPARDDGARRDASSDGIGRVDAAELPEGVLVARVGAGANCSSAGSAIDILFYTSVIAGAIAVALSAAFPPRPPADEGGAKRDGSGGDGEGPSGAGHPGDARGEVR